MHYSDKFSDEHKKLLNDYDVKAILTDHCHKISYYYEPLDYIPIFLSGSASQSTYLIAEYENKTLIKIFNF